MLNEINVTSQDLNTLTQELENAYANFNKSYKALEERLISLTSRGFTGDAAVVLMERFNTSVKPNSEAMMKVVNGVINTMHEKTAGFNRTVDSISDIAGR